jgi:hypothetical protein
MLNPAKTFAIFVAPLRELSSTPLSPHETE